MDDYVVTYVERHGYIDIFVNKENSKKTNSDLFVDFSKDTYYFSINEENLIILCEQNGMEYISFSVESKDVGNDVPNHIISITYKPLENLKSNHFKSLLPRINGFLTSWESAIKNSENRVVGFEIGNDWNSDDNYYEFEYKQL